MHPGIVIRTNESINKKKKQCITRSKNVGCPVQECQSLLANSFLVHMSHIVLRRVELCSTYLFLHFVIPFRSKSSDTLMTLKAKMYISNPPLDKKKTKNLACS